MSTRAFGAQLRRWRMASGLTQAELAEMFDLGQQAISKWESYGIEYDVKKFHRFDQVFKLPAGTAREAWVSSSESGGESSEPLEELRAAFEELRRRVDALEKAKPKRSQGQSAPAGRRRRA